MRDGSYSEVSANHDARRIAIVGIDSEIDWAGLFCCTCQGPETTGGGKTQLLAIGHGEKLGGQPFYGVGVIDRVTIGR